MVTGAAVSKREPIELPIVYVADGKTLLNGVCRLRLEAVKVLAAYGVMNLNDLVEAISSDLELEVTCRFRIPSGTVFEARASSNLGLVKGMVREVEA